MCVCSFQHPSFTQLIHCVHPIKCFYKPHSLCLFLSTPKFYTAHTLCPSYNKRLQTSYTVRVFLLTPTFTHLLHSLLVSTQWPCAGSDTTSSSVVTGEDEEKVVQNIELLEGCDDLAHAFVHCLHHPTVGPADVCCVEFLAHRVLFVLWGYLKRRCLKGDKGEHTAL